VRQFGGAKRVNYLSIPHSKRATDMKLHQPFLESDGAEASLISPFYSFFFFPLDSLLLPSKALEKRLPISMSSPMFGPKANTSF
jgi:hypothetical protein